MKITSKNVFSASDRRTSNVQKTYDLFKRGIVSKNAIKMINIKSDNLILPSNARKLTSVLHEFLFCYCKLNKNIRWRWKVKIYRY